MKKIFPLVISMMSLCACVQSGPVSTTETVPSIDYQRCLDAEKMGGGDVIETRCGKLQHEIAPTDHE
ncbi:hypothetical protein PMPD1_1428 [Paramixta manurensis]|uniref:Lipoprotein n=1 Tax=Paramixta manurensis TaxID=2740817 RepID=A0A6M8U6Z0_9GAMM|nr:hypothetical protein PMPD1_1428 [Erwiniaceae bacterium PD-1]